MQGFELVVEVAGAAAAGDGFVENRAALHLFDVLAEVADGQLFGDGDVAFVGRFLADDHAEEGGLAGAVGSDQADFFAGVELEGGVDEDELLAVLFVDRGKRDHLKPGRPGGLPYRTSSRRLRSSEERRGFSPPVETATCTVPRCRRAGTTKSHSSAESAILAKTPLPLAAIPMR